MVSLRLPSSFPQPPKQPQRSNVSPSFSVAAAAAAAAAAVGIGMGLAISLRMANPTDPLLPKSWNLPSPMWAAVSFSDGSAGTSVEPKTGAAFPSLLDATRRLLGIGLRKKTVLGLKNIDVYAFGVYADDTDIRKLKKKYETLSVSELKQSKEFYADILDQDLRMTVRLQIVYGRLSIRAVRNAFEESIGNRLQKFSGSENKELLQRFTSLFKDDYKLPRGSIIDLSREPGHILHTSIDGKEVGCIQSKLLCQSILDLYIGDDSFDKRAKEDIDLGLASLLQK